MTEFLITTSFLSTPVGNGSQMLFYVGIVLVTWASASVVSKIVDAVKKMRVPREVPEAPERTIPRVGSRRWARGLYYSQMITTEELDRFYAENPYNLCDPDR